MEKLWKIYGEESSKTEPYEITSSENTNMIYDNPDNILNQFANQVYEDTDKQFIGTVTESTGGDSNEVTYALYIVAPKLKDYMYRLIEVNVPNVMHSYPLEITLFAKDPKNHRTFNCETVVDFRNRLIDLINSSVTRAILRHLKTLIEINEQNIIKNYNFTLTDKDPTKIFSFKAASLPITIKKIILTSHIGKSPDIWGEIIANSFLKITATIQGGELEHVKQVSLMQFLSVYHVQPVLELKLILPVYDFYIQSRSTDSELNLTLISKCKNIKFDFFYDADKELVINK